MVATSDPMISLTIVLPVLTLVLLASYYDCRLRRIPNFLTFGAAVCAVVLHALFAGLEGLWFALGGLCTGFIFLIPGYALGKTGAGDVKLLAAVGAFVGPVAALVASAASLVTGGMVALGYAVFARGSRPWARYGAMFRCLLTTGQCVYIPPQADDVMAKSFPMAPAIAVGACVGTWYYLQQLTPLLKAG
jgi:prepilin peptidase CpaA